MDEQMKDEIKGRDGIRKDKELMLQKIENVKY